MKKLRFCFALTLLFFSCSKETGDYTLNGIYIETYPLAGRTSLAFSTGNTVILTEGLNSFPSKDTYNYRIIDDSIHLLLASSNQNFDSRFYFKLFKGDSFKIGNLYASIPEAPPVIMTFKK